MIRARGGAEACMSIARHRAYQLHGNVGRKQTIQFICETFTINLLTSIEMGYHLLCMYPRISATSSHYRNFFTKECRECPFQAFLHRDAIRLYLPAMIGCTIIG